MRSAAFAKSEVLAKLHIPVVGRRLITHDFFVNNLSTLPLELIRQYNYLELSLGKAIIRRSATLASIVFINREY